MYIYSICLVLCRLVTDVFVCLLCLERDSCPYRYAHVSMLLTFILLFREKDKGGWVGPADAEFRRTIFCKLVWILRHGPQN